MRDFRELRVWERAHAFTLAVYQMTRAFPSDERFGLTSQLRRSASSIGSVIAEGCGRSTNADFARFLSMAMGSAFETENHLLLARDLGYANADQIDSLLSEIRQIKRMLTQFLKHLKTTPDAQASP